MVKTLEKDPEKIAREARASKLVQMAREVKPEFEFNTNFSPAWITARTGSGIALHIYPYENRISVCSERYFPSAVRIADLFEKSGEPEFTVIKDYT